MQLERRQLFIRAKQIWPAQCARLISCLAAGQLDHHNLAIKVDRHQVCGLAVGFFMADKGIDLCRARPAVAQIVHSARWPCQAHRLTIT